MHLFETEMGLNNLYVPKFLLGSPVNKFYEFKTLLETLASQRDDQILDKFRRWINSQPALIRSKYTEYDAASNETIPLFKRFRQQKIAEYSPKTAEIDTNLNLIITNPYLVAVDKIKKLFTILNNLPDEQCDEIAEAWRQIRIQYAKTIVGKPSMDKPN
uniref:Uncharacterized protein n=1 Tax=Globodera pallida TaxID=36090 RepID=A0A183C7U0_GLOPA